MSGIATRERLAYIRQQAIKKHLDVRAVFAIASHEGLSGGVGDGGHAFGPGQMNDAGGVLTGAPAGHHNNRWAWSNQGINTWLNGLAHVAAGLHGRAAVSAIATRYERPADIQGEIADAMAHYGRVGMGGGAAPRQAAGGPVALSANRQFDASQFHKQAGMILLQSAAAQANGMPVDPNATLSMLQKARSAAMMKVQTAPGPGQGMPVAGANHGIGGRAVAIAARQIGTPYVWGGTNKSGFDCSGLTQFVYGKLGINIPRLAADQGRAGRAVNYSHLRPGDLLVEGNGDHVVMFAGNGRVIEAPHTGEKVKYAPLSWFPPSQYNARRIVG